MGQAAGFEAKLLVDKLDQVRQDIGEVEKRIKEISEGFAEYRYLLTIPGFGPYVSSVVLSAITDPRRFDNARQVLKPDMIFVPSGAGNMQQRGCACDIQERKRRPSVCFVSGSPGSIRDEQIL